MNNPFKAPEILFELIINTNWLNANIIVDDISLYSVCISYFETIITSHIESKDDDKWTVIAFFDDYEVAKKIYNNYYKIFPDISLKKSSHLDVDWVTEVQKNFTPIISGKFFIHNSFYKNEIMDNKISIMIDPGRAFGTGEHETTSLCLEAISNLDIKGKILDIGCGSGILAIAASKIFNGEFIAVDIDEIAVDCTKNNAIKNNNKENIICEVSDGCKSDIVQKNAPYDLIIANILANPLIEMAYDITNILTKDGKVILSGFLINEEEKLLNIYSRVGLFAIERYNQNNWVAVVLGKNTVLSTHML